MREWKKPSINDQSAGSLAAFGQQISRIGSLRIREDTGLWPGTKRTKYGVIPTPAIDGTTVTFSVATASPTNNFVVNSTRVFVDGVHVIRGVHYTETPAAGTITFNLAPQTANGWESLSVDFDY